MGTRWQNALAWLGIGEYAEEAVTFSDTPPRPIDQVMYEMKYGSPTRIGRPEALSVPAVLRGRNLICSISTLPLVQFDASNNPVRLPLLEQIDPDVPNVVTLAQTVEDLLFEGISWWRITGKGADGYPTSARHLAPGTVSLVPPTGAVNPLPAGDDPRGAVVWVDGVETRGDLVIRFDSANPGLLKSGARAVRRALRLDEAAAMFADEPDASGYFIPTEGADPAEDTAVEKILNDWQASRKKRKTGYVPAAMEYKPVDRANPAEIQLIEQQKRADLALANALGLDPEDLGVSTTSRTYNNATDRRKDRINDVLSPYMSAITDRLSMGDVTRRGYSVRFDVDDYLRADPVSRVGYYQAMHDMGAMTAEEIRLEEGLPAEPAAGTLAAVVPLRDVSRETVAAAAGARVTFDAAPAVTLLPVQATFAVDQAARTITGLVLPYGEIAVKFGRRWRFRPGSLSWASPRRVKLLRDHLNSQPIGYAITLTDTPQGLWGTFSVARGPEGDRALALAEDGVLDGLSVGVEFDAADTRPAPDMAGVSDVWRGVLREVSMTAMPAFDSARLTSVTATAHQEGQPMFTADQAHDQQQAPQPQQFQQAPQQYPFQAPVAHAPAPAPQPAPAPAPAPAPVPQAAPVQFDQAQLAQFAMLMQHIQQGGMVMPPPAPAPEQPQLVHPNPTGLQLQVTEEAPYRFDRDGNLRSGSKNDFSTDLIAGSQGDREALDRAMGFVTAQFDVDKADAATLNPTVNRPDMYVDQKLYQYPVWEAIRKGTLGDITPFVFPKFSSATGLVAAHVEGVEPTAGTYVATSQTVTPVAKSGKVEITREAWDQGGNPQLSNLIWQKMVTAWFEALEAAAVAVLDAATPTAIALTAGGGTTGQTLDSEITAAFAGLQFIRGGFRFTDMFTQIDLFKALVAAKDGNARRLYPAIGPQNASGTVSSRFATIDVNGVTAFPSWALAATGAVVASSYLFDRADVHGWATAPQRLEFQYRVAYVDLAIWGYVATAISDVTGVREITYDPVA